MNRVQYRPCKCQANLLLVHKMEELLLLQFLPQCLEGQLT